MCLTNVVPSVSEYSADSATVVLLAGLPYANPGQSGYAFVVSMILELELGGQRKGAGRLPDVVACDEMNERTSC